MGTPRAHLQGEGWEPIVLGTTLGVRPEEGARSIALRGVVSDTQYQRAQAPAGTPGPLPDQPIT
eukprot:853134-Prymnesium_polylepis.2